MQCLRRVVFGFMVVVFGVLCVHVAVILNGFCHWFLLSSSFSCSNRFLLYMSSPTSGPCYQWIPYATPLPLPKPSILSLLANQKLKPLPSTCEAAMKKAHAKRPSSMERRISMCIPCSRCIKQHTKRSMLGQVYVARLVYHRLHSS